MADLSARLEGAEISGTGELRLAPPFAYRGSVTLRDWDLATIRRLYPDLGPTLPSQGRLSTTAEARGTLQPLTLTTAGTAKADDLTVDALKCKNLSYTWKSDKDRLTLENVQARAYEGTLHGRAEIPLRPTVAGSVDLQAVELDIGALTNAMSALPFSLDGRAGGKLKGTLGAAPSLKERPVVWDLDLQAARLRLQGIPTEQFKAQIGYHQGAVDYRLEGIALGGRLNLDGQVPPVATAIARLDDPRGKQIDQQQDVSTKECRLRLQRARLSGVSEIFHLRSELLPLRGLLDLDIKYRHNGPDRSPVGAGRVVVTRPRWGEWELASIAQGDVILTPRDIRLRDITATFGEGTLHSQLAFNFQNLERSWFTLSVQGVEASRVLESWPILAGKAEGHVEAHLRGRLGREWSGSGDLFLSRGKVMGVEVSDLRLPLTWNFAPGDGRGQIDCPETSARLATGRATGHTTFVWGTGSRLEGQLRFSDLELSTLMHRSDSNGFGSGRVSGRCDFAAADSLSLNDLNGHIEATLTQNQAFEFPVLRQVAPFLGIQTSSSFESGEVRARLAHGVIRIQSLLLQRQSLQVSVEGNAPLLGPLDLQVKATTGLNALVPLRLPVPGAIPVLTLSVRGTVNHPDIRREPVGLLSR
jgi:hypothetical protein